MISSETVTIIMKKNLLEKMEKSTSKWLKSLKRNIYLKKIRLFFLWNLHFSPWKKYIKIVEI